MLRGHARLLFQDPGTASEQRVPVGLVATQWNNPRHLRAIEAAAAQARDDRRLDDHLESAVPTPYRVDLRLSTALRSKIVEEYLAGCPSRTPALRYAVSKAKVIELVREAGHEPRRRGPVPRRSSP